MMPQSSPNDTIKNETAPAVSGMRIRSGLRAGAWKCGPCTGKLITGTDGMRNSKCDYCMKA